MQVTLLVYVASKAIKRTVISTSIFTIESVVVDDDLDNMRVFVQYGRNCG